MNKRGYWGILFFVLSLFFICSILIYFFGDKLGFDLYLERIKAILFLSLGCLLFLVLYSTGLFGWKKLGEKDFLGFSKRTNQSSREAPPQQEQQFTQSIKTYCYACYGLLWRRRLTKCLVLGTAADTEQLLPNLSTQRWQTADNILMIYGGDSHELPDTDWLSALKKGLGRWPLLRRKPIDAVILLLPANYLSLTRHQQAQLTQTVVQLQARNKVLGWQSPIYLVSTQASDWSQAGRTEQSVGLLFNNLNATSIAAVAPLLEQLAEQCCTLGTQQVINDHRHAFLLQLSQQLQQRDGSLIVQWLSKWLSLPKAPAPRGLLFSPVVANEHAAAADSYLPEHHLLLTPAWQTVRLDSQQQRGKPLGIDWPAAGWSVLIAMLLLVSVGLVSSYFNNRTLINHSSELLSQLEQSQSATYADRLQAQYALQLQLNQLLYRQQAGVPLSYRFGLSHNHRLLAALWPHYLAANNRNIAQPFLDWQTDYLQRLAAMSPADPKRVQLINSSYDVLKAYLMLTHPDKTDAAYLGEFASRRWPAPAEVTAGEWQKMMPELVTFWGRSLIDYPSWSQASSAELVQDVRQILLNQIGVKNAETTIYQGILQRAGQNYRNMTLVQLLGDIDSRTLFSATQEVPGVFTRKAWQEVVEREINSAAKARQEQIDWVLSDDSSLANSSVAPDALRQRLTDRYFSDYSAAWLLFLNTIQWRAADNVADVIEQLTLMSDVRQSPLLALMNAVKYQAEVAYHGGGISDNLIRSAQALIKETPPASLTNKLEASGPLTPTFGPLLNLIDVASSSNELSLQTYLLRVTQVRLKLQNITSSANPQAMAKQLAKSVFQGTSVDLTETRDYGNLIAANLGEEWSGLGYSLFKQPLEQAWQVILTPAAKSFNETWQNQIAYEWEQAFAGRYPFKNSDSDASFAGLARFLRPDAGIIDQFITTELGGILEKQGGKWIINPINAQGLTFSPQFIESLALFNSLSSQFFSSGDAQMSFDLMARSGYNVARSQLMINKQKLDYFNQMPEWQRFNWPGDGYSPAAQLSYRTAKSGLQLYGYYFGDWAWIRLLESAQVKQLDTSRYELVWPVSDEHNLKYILRTQAGDGPLALLKLRQFTLPKQVFEVSKVDLTASFGHN